MMSGKLKYEKNSVIISCCILFCSLISKSFAPKQSNYLQSEKLGFGSTYIAYSAYWTEPHDKQYFKPLLVWHDQNGVAQKDSLFFDAFLLYQTTIKEGTKNYQLYQKRRRDKPAKLQHWEMYLNHLFKNQLELGGLNQAVLSLKIQGVLPKNYKAKVLIGIPYPDPRQKNFNDNPTNSMNFANNYSRLKALQFFFELLKKKWNKQTYSDLKLIGFYWIQESNFSDYPIKIERNFLLQVSKLTHSFQLYAHDTTRYNFIIIPSMPNTVGIKLYGKPGFTKKDYDLCGFDGIFMQPGILYGHTIKPIVKRYAYMSFVSQKAAKENFGISIELQPTADNNVNEMLKAFFAHLDAGYKFGFINSEFAKTYFFQPYWGNDKQGKAYHGLPVLYYQKVPNVDKKIQRDIYDYTYQFVRGYYRPSEKYFKFKTINKYIFPN